MKKFLLVFVAVFAMIVSGCASKSGSTTVSSDSSATSNSGASDGRDAMWATNIASGIGKIYFDFDRYDIKPAMQDVVNAGANVLKSQAQDAEIIVEGNCDEWGTDEYNQALGLRRANAVKKALVTLGLNADQISVKSYGETNPVCTERTKECDALNRRAEIKVGF